MGGAGRSLDNLPGETPMILPGEYEMPSLGCLSMLGSRPGVERTCMIGGGGTRARGVAHSASKWRKWNEFEQQAEFLVLPEPRGW